MRLVEIEAEGATPEALLIRAKADAEPLKAALSRAETALAKAAQEQSRLRSLYGRLQSKSLTLLQRHRQEKTAALEAVAREAETDGSWNLVRKTRRELDEVLASIQFTLSWAQPAADAAALEAEIEESERRADVLENEAVKQRLALASAASVALEYDPGAHLGMENSWSAKQMETVAKIRSRDIPELRSQLAKLRETTEREQAEVSNRLFS